MKGTLFSADFVKDSNQNLRLLELNTDTGVVSDQIANIDLSGLITVLSSNSIDTLEIVYKPYIHNPVVEKIQEIIAADATFITTVNLHDEDRNSIYPTIPEDAANKFILRLAYDESAILDSTYCKNRLTIYKLFAGSPTGSDVHKVPGFYHSGSEGEVNTLDYEINSGVFPDAAIKDVDESFNPIDFYKIGSEAEGEETHDRWRAFITASKGEDKLIEQYHFHSSSLDSSGKLTGVRQFSIVYGTNLDTVNILSYKAPAVFTPPTDISSEYNAAAYINKLSDVHYYEYTNSYPTKGSAGLLSTHELLLHPTSSKAIGDIEVGDVIQSYFVSGSPQVETNLDVINWSISGSSFPSGSYLTASSVVFTETDALKYGGTVEISVGDESVFVGVNKQFLVYDSGSDVTKYKYALELDSTNDYFFDYSASLIDIDAANFYITTDTGSSFIEIDVEDTDTYLISGSESFNFIVAHNAPCFVAGTQISLGNGDTKNIEDVVVGDEVKSYNFTKGEVEVKAVNAIGAKQVTNTVVYTFEDGTRLEATPDHPLYCKNHGWVSNDPDYTAAVYNLTTTKVSIDCEIINVSGGSSKIVDILLDNDGSTVYNLRSVDGNHNFYANSFLVHNRCFVAGTQIEMANGTSKSIEEVQAGEEVRSVEFFEGEVKGETITHNSEPPFGFTTSVVESVKVSTVVDTYLVNWSGTKLVGDEKTHLVDKFAHCTGEHPFYTNRGWVEAKNLVEGDQLAIMENNTWVTVTESLHMPGEQTVYNLINVTPNNNYYANGVLVHNKV